MGVNYKQYCIIGFGGNREDCKKVLSEEKYEEQPRYDTKTGEISHYEKVLIKKEDNNYKLFGYSNEYMTELLEDIHQEFDLDFAIDYNEGDFAVGYYIGDNDSLGRVDLLTGEVDIDDLIKKRIDVADKLNCSIFDVKLHFLNNVG